MLFHEVPRAPFIGHRTKVTLELDSRFVNDSDDHYFLAAKKAMIAPTTSRKRITSASPPQNGKVTSHQDHVMYPVSFRVTKTRPNRAENVMPLPPPTVTFVFLLMSVPFRVGLVGKEGFFEKLRNLFRSCL